MHPLSARSPRRRAPNAFGAVTAAAPSTPARSATALHAIGGLAAGHRGREHLERDPAERGGVGDDRRERRVEHAADVEVRRSPRPRGRRGSAARARARRGRAPAAITSSSQNTAVMSGFARRNGERRPRARRRSGSRSSPAATGAADQPRRSPPRRADERARVQDRGEVADPRVAERLAGARSRRRAALRRRAAPTDGRGSRTRSPRSAPSRPRRGGGSTSNSSSPSAGPDCERLGRSARPTRGRCAVSISATA